jgi:uncharacterized membrane protein
MKLTEFLKRNWLAFTLAILPFLILPFYWDQLPAEIPTHWNARGEVDAYGSPATLFLMPGITLFTLAIIWLVPVIDPKKNVQQFQKTLDIIALVLSAFFLVIFITMVRAALGYESEMGNLVFYGVIFLFMILGNYFGKIRPNYFVGIRTPWTLESETVWLKTHRMAGKLWVAGSLVMLIAKILLPMEDFFSYVFIVFVVILSLVPIVYSYVAYQQLDSKKE